MKLEAKEIKMIHRDNDNTVIKLHNKPSLYIEDENKEVHDSLIGAEIDEINTVLSKHTLTQNPQENESNSKENN